MNISFYDGINDGKFFNISAGKYDELDDIDDINVDDIDISEEKCDSHDDLPCEDCECEGLKELQDEMRTNWNEMRTHLAMINKANMRLNQLGNKISDLKEFRDETYELQYGQLLDRLNLIEKKLEVFKCIDILDRVTKLEEQVDRVTKLEEKVEKLERGLTSNGMLIADFGRHINDTDCNLSSLSDRVSKLDSKLAVTAQIVDTINSTISGYGHDYVIIADRINELESKLEKLDIDVTSNMENNMDKANDRMGIIEKKLTMFYDILDRVTKLEKKVNEELDWKDLTGTTVFESIKNGILDSIKRLEMENPTPIYYDNELKYFTTPGCVKGEIHDSVNHPSHYTDGKYETIEFIEEYGMRTHIGNAIKYASRAGKKDEDAYVEDLKKGLWYLHRYNCPPKKKHIDVLDYCKDKKLPDELTNVLIAISRENYVEAERVLRKYIEELKK